MGKNYATLALVSAFALIFISRVWGLPWTPARIVGAAIAAPAFVLFCVARIQLGRAFSLRAKATTLVTTGLYSRIRNPIYVFGALMLAGVIIFVNEPWFLLCYVALIPMQIYRSRKEQRVLTEKFGAAYLEYKRKTWF